MKVSTSLTPGGQLPVLIERIERREKSERSRAVLYSLLPVALTVVLLGYTASSVRNAQKQVDALKTGATTYTTQIDTLKKNAETYKTQSQSLSEASRSLDDKLPPTTQPRTGDLVFYPAGYAMFYVADPREGPFVLGMTPFGIAALKSDFAKPVGYRQVQWR